ncbi:MAG: hypothetical protein COA99_11525 [Moraxellaceae bacterium]|nr:MAG: hypothetical protein COA99_11525 [Moraxellaceae bacterium]
MGWGAASAEEVPQAAKDLIPTLKTWGMDAALISAVKEQNASGLTLDQIKASDKTWRAEERLSPFMKGMMESAAAKALLALEGTKPFYFELFLMDNQGANVAMTNKTSDYWQGDEAKFTESFKGGVGAVHVGKVKFDDSAQAYLVQISVPVMDGGKAIGAITIGVNLDDLEGK